MLRPFLKMLIIFLYISISHDLFAEIDNEVEKDHFFILSSELNMKGLARIYLHRDNSFVKPASMNEEDLNYFRHSVVGSQMKFNIMSFEEDGLAPFAQLIASPTIVGSVYVDVVPGEIALLIQMLNVANFGVRQGWVDKITLNVEAGNIYHIAAGLESFRSFGTFSGFARAELPKDTFNKCLDLKKNNFDQMRILDVSIIHQEILSCAGLLEGSEQREIKNKFTKWVKKNEASMIRSLQKRREIDAKRELKRAKRKAKKQKNA